MYIFQNIYIFPTPFCDKFLEIGGEICKQYGNFFFDFTGDQRASSFQVDLFFNTKDVLEICTYFPFIVQGFVLTFPIHHFSNTKYLI